MNELVRTKIIVFYKNTTPGIIFFVTFSCSIFPGNSGLGFPWLITNGIMMKKRGFILLVFGLYQGIANAQVLTEADTLHTGDSRLSVNIDATLGVPKGEFAETLDRYAYGGEFEVLYHFKGLPFAAGGSFLYQHFGTTRERLFAGINYKTTSGMFVPSLLVRIDPKLRNFSPYIEGTLGGNFINAQTKVSGLIVNILGDDEEENTLREFYSVSLSYGFGAGVKILLKDWSYPGQDKTRLYLHLKARYSYGGEARYLLKDGVEIIDHNSYTEIRYYTTESRTDLLTFSAGIYIGL